MFAPDRLDGNLVDRLLSKCGDNLSLLAASAMLDRTIDLTETALDQLLDILRGSTPSVVLDMPHVWTGWARRTLVSADEIVIVAAPELASLRNTKNLLDVLKAGPAERPQAAGRPEPDRHAEAARDPGRRVRKALDDRARRPSCPSMRSSSGPPPTTAR